MPTPDSLMKMLENYQAADAAEHDMVRRTIVFLGEYDNALSPECAPGHITASAWVIDYTRSLALLTHHRKLGRWFQLGGHLQPGEAVPDGAWREAREESGLNSVQMLDSGAVFDVDVHLIPARGALAEHFHYDVRFLFEADASEPVSVSAESRALAWVPLLEAHRHNSSESILRMVRKTLRRWPMHVT